MNGGRTRSSKYTAPESFGTMTGRDTSNNQNVANIIKAMGNTQTGQGLQSLTNPVATATPAANQYASMQGWASPQFLNFLNKYSGTNAANTQLAKAQNRYGDLSSYRNQGLASLLNMAGSGDQAVRKNVMDAIAMLSGTYNPNAMKLS